MLRDGSIEVFEGTTGADDHGTQCDRVHRTLKRIGKARAALDAQEATALREADQLRLWRRYGCTSLVDYMERELNYSPRAAIERLRVIGAIVDLPAIASALEQGELSYSAARELTRVATPETEAAWLAASEDKNLREIEEAVSGHVRGDLPTDPIDPNEQMYTLTFRVKAQTYALHRQAVAILERETGEHLDDSALISALSRPVVEGTSSADRDRPLHQIAVTLCRECNRGWQDGGGVTVELTKPAIERALCDAVHIGSLDREGTERATQTIPPAIRRKVKHRDHGRCCVPGCRSRVNLDVHHLEARADGGTHDEANLCTLCEAHHLAFHEGALVITGQAPNLTFTRRGRNRFELECHAVDTAKALATMGFKRHEVSEAMKRTRTHVGIATLTLQEWIKIALGYCPRPNGS